MYGHSAHGMVAKIALSTDAKLCWRQEDLSILGLATVSRRMISTLPRVCHASGRHMGAGMRC